MLLHMCCAPCTTYPLKMLKNNKYDVEGYFYNPNIHPFEEYEQRKNTVEEYSKLVDLKVHYVLDYQEEKWLNYKETDRCQMCYEIRLEATAKFAVENNFLAFSTTLLVSPYQNHELIKKICENLSKKYNIKFVYYDFREGYREGQNIARELKLYRQKYCGCIHSYLEREMKTNVK